MTTYIADTEHYSEVVSQMCKARRLLWIETADLKDLYVMQGKDDAVPFLQILRDLLKKGVEVRLLHAKNRERLSVRTSTNTLCSGNVWNVGFVRVFT